MLSKPDAGWTSFQLESREKVRKNMMIFPDWYDEWIVLDVNEHGVLKEGYKSMSLKPNAPKEIQEEFDKWIAILKDAYEKGIRL